MRSCDDGKISVERLLDKLIEMVFMVVGQQDAVHRGQLVKIDGGIRPALGRYSRTKMHMISCMQEVGVCQDTKTTPFEDCGGIANEVYTGVFSAC
jgi:hypothetical protein